MPADTFVLGAGMSGLGAALSLGVPAYEAEARPGGVCYSFYVDRSGARRDPVAEGASGCFRFEPAGGHWLFGPSPRMMDLLGRHARFTRHTRRAAVWFAATGRIVPFPIQDHLRWFDPALRGRILGEILAEPPASDLAPRTFHDWLVRQFGPTLCELFFLPFNERYTAGLCAQIAPQDAYKTPIHRDRILAGAQRHEPSPGYNAVFYYPDGGLDRLVRALASAGEIHCNHRVVQLDRPRRTVSFSDGRQLVYRELVSSIPLDRMMSLCGADGPVRPDPATAVLVVNIAAQAGPACPPYHWLYVPDARSGLHRVGFYSHVDPAFLPAGSRGLVSLYVERSYRSGHRLDAAECARACGAIVDELRAWQFIGEPIVVHPTFTDPAYTWSWPGSTWVDQARRTLLEDGIRQIGRYGTWRFQGMADSFEQGWALGSPA